MIFPALKATSSSSLEVILVVVYARTRNAVNPEPVLVTHAMIAMLSSMIIWKIFIVLVMPALMIYAAIKYLCIASHLLGILINVLIIMLPNLVLNQLFAQRTSATKIPAVNQLVPLTIADMIVHAKLEH